jgi:hypothetical protein
VERLRGLVPGLKAPVSPSFRFIDLFAGIGGMRYGFEAIGSVFHQERPPQEKVNLSLGCSWARHWERKAAGRQFCSRR